MFAKLLVPLDGTESSMKALPVAKEIARRFGASVLLLEMVSTGAATLAMATDVATGAMTDPNVIATDTEIREQAAEGFVSAVAEELAADGIDASYTTGRGGEDEGIAAVVAEQGVDLVVMATHQRSGLRRLFSGSVTDDVLRHVHVPVLVVPAPAE